MKRGVENSPDGKDFWYGYINSVVSLKVFFGEREKMVIYRGSHVFPEGLCMHGCYAILGWKATTIAIIMKGE